MRGRERGQGVVAVAARPVGAGLDEHRGLGGHPAMACSPCPAVNRW
ncbi:hypothetical protein ACWEWI_35915 [Streptomyces sp. NPDC003753]|nr:hypothetical protein [Streptomyces sp. Y2F8-2]